VVQRQNGTDPADEGPQGEMGAGEVKRLETGADDGFVHCWAVPAVAKGERVESARCFLRCDYRDNVVIIQLVKVCVGAARSEPPDNRNSAAAAIALNA
jgi:hypothetical protein